MRRASSRGDRDPREPGSPACARQLRFHTTVRRGSFALVSLLVAGAALAADFSGTWSISSKVGDNPVSIQCTLVQRDNALTGTCKPSQFDPSATTGTVSGSKATWGYDVVFNGNQNHVEYEATLEPDGKLTGTLHLGPTPTPFTAVKQ